MTPNDQHPIAYVSSTPGDLQEYRSRVAQELRQAGYRLAGREGYGAECDYLLRQRLAAVYQCDIFVGIVAMHYGDTPALDEFANLSIPDVRAGEASFTECEYRQALATNKRILMFLLDEDVAWPPSHTDFRTGHGDRGLCLQAWRDVICRGDNTSTQSIHFFKNLDDLGTKVRELVAPRPAADQLALPPRHNLPPFTYPQFVGRESQLRQIEHALHEAQPLICVEGPMGAGRTSLALAAGYAYCRPRTAPPQHYVVWVAAEAKADKSLELDDVLTLIAQVANYKGLAQVSLAANKDKEQDIEQILRQHRFLLIVDNFDLIQSPKLKAWLLNPALPGHVLLIVQDAARQEPPLPPACTVKLAPLNMEDTLEHLALLGISVNETPGATPENLRDLAVYTKGEFRVTDLVARQLKERLAARVDFQTALTSVMQLEEADKIQKLHQRVWEDLPPEAHQLLCTTPLFASNSGIGQGALLAACGLPRASFEAAQTQLRDRGLLKWDDGTNTYTVDADTHSFAQEKLRLRPEFEIAARKRWSEFYRKLVKQCMKRAEPDVPYWCSLVSSSMEALDVEWPAVVAVLDWADQHRKDHLLLNLVLLLTHYMDSRFYNKERLHYAGRGAQAARRLRLPYEEALLRIDALGWTYFEENCPHKALEEIGRGLGLVKPLGEVRQDAWELFRLGLAWQARVKMEIALLIDRAQPDSRSASSRDTSALASISPFEAGLLHTEAVHLIEKALRANCSPWIRYRILKAAGDIAFKARIQLRQLKDDKEALDFYLEAEQEVAKYGGEGASYQIGPRVGLAYLRHNDQRPDNPQQDDVAEAAKRFDKLCDDDHMPLVGKLYGKYGKALIEKHKGRKEEAQKELDSLKKELWLHTSSNQLLKLVMSFDEQTVVR